nr:MAG TPA: hypothetical protein [Caudoviricetes sp.]
MRSRSYYHLLSCRLRHFYSNIHFSLCQYKRHFFQKIILFCCI